MEYEYFCTGDKLTYMTQTTQANQGTAVTEDIWFYYDAAGTPYALKYQDEYFYYTTNAQGDVTAILNSSGNTVATYSYDAWGNPLAASGTHALANLNPLRYRGYVYDNETELYYLQSRYYNPEVGRFLNADAYASTGQGLLGNNMFAYCGNNPVNMFDPKGHMWKQIFAICITAAIGYDHISSSNYKKNSAVDNNPDTTTVNTLINDQNGTTGNNFVYGLYKAKHNGCEAIAVHNAKVLKGIQSSLSETIQDFQSSGAMIGYGAFGSNPYAIGDVLCRTGIDYSSVGVNEMTQTGTYIFSFWNDNAPWGGLHTIAVSYDGSKYVAYNLYGDGNPYSIDPSNYADSYICGYYLG